jgi:hypothetical protein
MESDVQAVTVHAQARVAASDEPAWRVGFAAGVEQAVAVLDDADRLLPPAERPDDLFALAADALVAREAGLTAMQAALREAERALAGPMLRAAILSELPTATAAIGYEDWILILDAGGGTLEQSPAVKAALRRYWGDLRTGPGTRFAYGTSSMSYRFDLA